MFSIIKRENKKLKLRIRHLERELKKVKQQNPLGCQYQHTSGSSSSDGSKTPNEMFHGEELRRGVSRRTLDIRDSFPRRNSRTEMRNSMLQGIEYQKNESHEMPFKSNSYGDFLLDRSLSRNKSLSRKERQDAVKQFLDSTRVSKQKTTNNTLKLSEILNNHFC